MLCVLYVAPYGSGLGASITTLLNNNTACVVCGVPTGRNSMSLISRAKMRGVPIVSVRRRGLDAHTCWKGVFCVFFVSTCLCDVCSWAVGVGGSSVGVKK